MALEILSSDDIRTQILPRHYHAQLIIKTDTLELSILFNHVVGLPDLYISSQIELMGLSLTPKEHPVDNKVMYWLHECNFAKALPENCPNLLVLWLSTLIENVFAKSADLNLNKLRQLVTPEIVSTLER